MFQSSTFRSVPLDVVVDGGGGVVVVVGVDVGTVVLSVPEGAAFR
jgi:hypothetical protein